MTGTEARLAVIGCGAAARQCHIPGLVHLPGMRLAAAVDPIAANAARLIEDYALLGGNADGVMLAQTPCALAGVDLAVIAAPHSEHRTLALECARRGIHCLVEKPMALTEADCRAMIDAAQTHGTALGTAFVRRLFPASVLVRQMIKAGELGTIVELQWREGAPYDWPLTTPSLFAKSQAGGGVIADTGPHVFDLIQWILGGSAEIVRCRDTSAGGVEADALIHMRVGNVPVVVELSRTRPLANRCSIAGTSAGLSFGLDLDSSLEVRRMDGSTAVQPRVAAIPPAQAEWELLFTEQLRNFAAATRGIEPIYADGEAGLGVTRLIEACYAIREPFPLPWRDRIDDAT